MAVDRGLGLAGSALGSLYDAERARVADRFEYLLDPKQWQLNPFPDPFRQRDIDPAAEQAAMAEIMGEGLGMAVPMGGIMGKIVYHGSPHRFDAFDMSKIGTGEGAQAYGHGLYFADSPAVAQSYANDGAVKYGDLLRIGRHEIPRDDWRFEAAVAAKRAIEEGESLPRYLTEKQEKWAEAVRGRGLDVEVAEPLLYKADIPDEAITRMLDWDAPLSEQAPEVRDVLEKNFGLRLSTDKHLTGEEIYNYVASQTQGSGGPWTKYGAENSQQAGSNVLGSLGIPGIRYKDAMSRGTDAGTSNYVLLDDRLPRILEINDAPTGLQPWAPGEADDLLGLSRIAKEAPYDEAHRIAQRNAALPVEQGGLGLPPDNTAMDRARAMGFDTDALHGSASGGITKFDESQLGRATNAESADAFWLASPESKNPDYYAGSIESEAFMVPPGADVADINKRAIYASPQEAIERINKKHGLNLTEKDFFPSAESYTEGGLYFEAPTPDGGTAVVFGPGGVLDPAPTIYPLKVSPGRMAQAEYGDEALSDLLAPLNIGAADSVKINNVTLDPGAALWHMAIRDPSRIRSRFAAFDPMRRDSADLLASIAPWLTIGGLGVLGSGYLEDYD